MAIGDVAVRVVPDAENFWRSFRARTEGQAQAEGRRAGEEFRRGLEGANSRPIQVRADLDAARLRAQLDELTRSQTVRVRAEVNTTRARAELQSLERQGNKSGGGLIKALLPLAPALFPLAGAALAAGSGLAVMGGAGVLAVTGLNRELHSTSETGGRAAAAVGVIKNELHSLQSVAAKAALPGLEASVVTIRRELPGLRQVIGEQASVAGQVIAHLTSGIVGGFTTFRPIISAVGSDVDALAAHFDKFANGPGGARFARTLASDYAEVKPVLESVVRAVVDIARAGSQGGLGILHILGEVANVIDSFPTPVLTAIVDGFLAFRAIGLASAAIAGVQRAFSGVRSSLAGVAAATQLAAAQRVAAEAEVAAATAAAEAEMRTQMLASAEAAQAFRLEQILSNDGLSASELALLEVQAAAADTQIAGYEAVAAAAQASALEQAAAAEAAAAAVTASRAGGVGSIAGTLGKTLGPIALVGGAVAILSTVFADDGQAAQEAAGRIDGYSSALVSSKGAIDATVRSQVAKNLADKGLFDFAAKAGISQAQLTDAVIAGGSALDTAANRLGAYEKAQGGNALAVGVARNALHSMNDELQSGEKKAADQRAATESVTAAVRAHADALHTDVATYQAATDAAAKSTAQTRSQTVAFQLENDAASLLSQALKGLAGQNLDVAQAQTGFAQSTNSAIAALKKGKDAITGHSDAALADQQAIQGSVSAARQLADAVAKQSGSSDKAAASYRNSRNALLSQLRAQGVLTPAVRKYINTLFDVKGVSDYLTKHPTKHDVQIATAAAEAKIRATQAKIDGIRQGRKPDIGIDDIAAFNAISRLQAVIDALHGKTVTVTTITRNGSGVSVGSGGRGFGLADGGIVRGPGTGRSDTAGVYALSNGEAVIPERAVSANIGLVRELIRAGRGLAAGGIVHKGNDWIYNGIRYASERAAQNAQTRAEQKTNKSAPTHIQNLIGQIGQQSSAPFDINQQGFRAISAQIRRAQVALLSWHVPLEKTRKYEEQIIRLSTILQHQLQNLRIKVNGADLAAVKKALGGTASDLHEAFRTLNTDLRNIGSSSLNLSRARKQEGQILTANRRYTAARDYSASIKDTLAGSFDPTHFGSTADLVAGLRGQTGQNNTYARELTKLRRESKGDKTLTAFINQLAASGQTATLESLAGASKTDLANVSKSLGAYNQSVVTGANAATVSKYGATDTQLRTVLTKLDKRLDAWIAAEVKFTATLAESHRRSPEHTARQIEHALSELETLVRHGRA